MEVRDREVQASEEEEKKRVKVAWYLTSLSIWARNSLSLKKLFHWLSSFMLSGYSKKGRSRKMKEKCCERRRRHSIAAYVVILSCLGFPRHHFIDKLVIQVPILP